MTTKFIYQGKTITWANGTGSKVNSNDVVVVGDLVCVALVDIADGETGELATEGVFEVPKASGTAFTQGKRVDWDASAGNFAADIATPATGDVTDAVIAWEDAASGDTTARVKLLNDGTVTP